MLSELSAKDKGTYCELIAMEFMARLGYKIESPFLGGDHAHDFRMSKDNKSYKVQVKKMQRGKHVCIKKINKKITAYDPEEVDFFAAVDADNYKVYLIPYKEAVNKGKHTVAIQHLKPFEVKLLENNKNGDRSGVIAELIAIQHFFISGCNVCTSVSDSSPFDLLTNLPGGVDFKKVQVKKVIKSPSLAEDCIKVYRYIKGKVVYKYKKEDVDFIAGVDLDSREMYLIPIEALEDYSRRINVKKVKNYLFKPQ